MSDFSENLKKLMDSYDIAKRSWIEIYGNDDDFDKWVLNTMLNKIEDN